MNLHDLRPGRARMLGLPAGPSQVAPALFGANMNSYMPPQSAPAMQQPAGFPYPRLQYPGVHHQPFQRTQFPLVPLQHVAFDHGPSQPAAFWDAPFQHAAFQRATFHQAPFHRASIHQAPLHHAPFHHAPGQRATFHYPQFHSVPLIRPAMMRSNTRGRQFSQRRLRERDVESIFPSLAYWDGVLGIDELRRHFIERFRVVIPSTPNEYLTNMRITLWRKLQIDGTYIANGLLYDHISPAQWLQELNIANVAPDYVETALRRSPWVPVIAGILLQAIGHSDNQLYLERVTDVLLSVEWPHIEDAIERLSRGEGDMPKFHLDTVQKIVHRARAPLMAQLVKFHLWRRPLSGRAASFDSAFISYDEPCPFPKRIKLESPMLLPRQGLPDRSNRPTHRPSFGTTGNHISSFSPNVMGTAGPSAAAVNAAPTRPKTHREIWWEVVLANRKREKEWKARREAYRLEVARREQAEVAAELYEIARRTSSNPLKRKAYEH